MESQENLDELACNLWVAYLAGDKPGQELIADLYCKAIAIVSGELNAEIELLDNEVGKWIRSLPAYKEHFESHHEAV